MLFRSEEILKQQAAGLFEGFVPDETFTDLQTITWALQEQSKELGRLQDILVIAKEKGVDQGTSFVAVAANAAGLTSSINALVDAQIRLTAETKTGPNVDVIATILKGASTQIDQFTKKAQDKRDKAETAFEAMRDKLVTIGAEGQVKLQELQMAYSSFLFKLDTDDAEKAQKKADKAVLIEENKLARLRAVLIEQQGLGTDAPGEVGSLPMEQEEARYQLVLEGLERRRTALEEAGHLEAEAYGLIEAEKTAITQIHEEKRRQIAEDVAQQKRDLEMSVVNSAVGLLNVLAQKSKAAAIVSLAVTKGLAIAQVLARTQEAAVLAYSSQLIPGVPATYGTAAAAYTSTIAMGNTSAALIAATGLAQAASLGGGAPSGGGGGGSGGGGVGPSPIVEDNTSRQQVIINNYGAITSEEFVVEVANAIQQGSDADIISIDVQGVTAEVRTV